MRTYLLAFCLCIISSLQLHADLVWNQNQGWTVQGGILENTLGGTPKAKNAIEMMNTARLAQETEDYSNALSLYHQIYTHYKTSILAPEALYQIGIIRYKKHQYKKAFQAFNKIVNKYPDYERFKQVIDYQFEIAASLMEGKRPYYWGVIPGFKDYDAAIDFFERLVKNAPFSNRAPKALIFIAQLSQKHREADEAIKVLDRIINEYPLSLEAEEAYLLLAETHRSLVKGEAYDQGATREAINYYQDFITLYPNSKYLARAQSGLIEAKNLHAQSRIFIGDFYYKYRNKPKAALALYKEALDLTADSVVIKKAKDRIQIIQNRIPPPKTPVDFLFGRYQDTELDYQSNSEV